MKLALRFLTCLITLAFIIPPFAAVTAQEGTFPLLILTTRDSANPILLQVLAPGEEAASAGLAKEVRIQEPIDANVYVAFKNTGGWSKGTVGFLSGELSRDNKYIALEVDSEGAPVPDGQAFEFSYYAGVFLVPILIDRPRTLAVFQIAPTGGLKVSAQTSVMEGTTVTQNPVEYQIVSESPFGSIVLECHITAP